MAVATAELMPIAIRVPERTFKNDLRAMRIVWHRDVIRFWRDRPRMLASLLQPVLYLFVFGTGMASMIPSARGVDLKTFLFPGVLVIAGLVGVPYAPGLLVTLLAQLVLLSFSITALGVLVAIRIRTIQSFMAIVQMLIMPTFFLSGALYPLTDPDEPGPSLADQRLLVGWRRSTRPTVEPGRRGARVVVPTAAVLGRVLEHVEQGSPGLAGSLQLMRVIAIGEDRTAVAQSTVNGMHHANREGLHAAREGVLVVGLDDQVQMVRLNRELHHAKGGLLARGDRAAHRLEQQPIVPQARDAFASAHRDMHRMVGQMPFAASVRYARPETGRFGASAATGTAMARLLFEVEFLVAHSPTGPADEKKMEPRRGQAQGRSKLQP